VDQGDLAWLADVDLSRLRLTYGLTSSLSLAVNYSFTLDEMRSAAFSPSGSSEAMKTGFHETVHVYQMTGTSYGYYCQLLRDFQVNQVILMVEAIRRDYRVGPRLPIARQVLGLPDEPAARSIRHLLRTWYLAESMLLWFEGDTDAFSAMMGNVGKVFYQHPLIAVFSELNWWLTGFVAETGRAALPEPDRHIFLPWSEPELAERESPYIAWKMFADNDAAGVLESAARAAEYWGQGGPVPATMLGGEAGVPVHLIRYAALLREASQLLPTDDVHTFALTYGVVADVVLNAPLLPQHAPARSAETGLADLDPMSRMRTALRQAARIAPVRELSGPEYSRFAGELCDACGWQTPAMLGRLVLDAATDDPPDLITKLYRYAVEFRMRYPHIFNDLSVLYGPKTPVSSEFTYYFSHPVIQFSDTVRLHNDQELVSFFVQNHMLRSHLRRVLLSQDPTVTLPYAADQEEVSAWTDLLAATLEDVGFIDPRLEVRPGPIRPPH
jgi:hypothetical protein